MADIYHNLVSGTITDNPLAIGATTINSAGFANLPVVSAPDTLRITLDPDGVSGLPEIVLVTTHAGASTAITVTRGQETANGGNAAHSHPLNTVWRHASTRAAFEELPYRKVTTKGDILVATGDKATSRVAAGTNGHSLVADSGQANGVKWAGKRMGGAQVSSVQTISTALETDITGFSITFTAEAGHVYRADWSFNIQSETGNFTVRIYDGAASLAVVYVENISDGLARMVAGFYELVGLSAASHTIKLTIDPLADAAYDLHQASVVGSFAIYDVT